MKTNAIKMPMPPHKPTDRQRVIVETLAGYGVPTDQIAEHPDVDVSRTTLWKHYAREIAIGNARALGKIGEALFQRAIGTKEHPGSDTLLIFLGKTRLGLKEISRVEQTGADGGPIEIAEEAPRERINRSIARLRLVGGTETNT